MEVVPPGSNKILPPGKLSRRQFTEIVSCFLYKKSSSVSNDLVKIVTNKRDYDRLIKSTNTGKLRAHEVWIKGSKLVEKEKFQVSDTYVGNIREADVSNTHISASSSTADVVYDASIQIFEEVDTEAEVDFVNSIDKNNPFLVKSGLLDFTNQNVDTLFSRMESWNPNEDDVTNGLVLEVSENFCGSAAVKLLAFKLFQILNFHPSQQNSSVKRFIQLFKHTPSKMLRCSDPLECKWYYFQDLSAGGKLFRPELLEESSAYEEMVWRLNKSADIQNKNKTCQYCFTIGDYFCCQGCFSVFYCSEACQNSSWIQNHRFECPILSRNIVKNGARLPPEGPEYDHLSTPPGNLRNKYRTSLKKITSLETKNSELSEQLKQAQADIKYLGDCSEVDKRVICELKEEIEDLKVVVLTLKKEKAGKASAYVKLKRKVEDLDSDDDEDEEM